MAPEVFQGNYSQSADVRNDLCFTLNIDSHDFRRQVYAFGMCVLELITGEYPYAECKTALEIRRKVCARVKPEALRRVQSPDLRGFIEICLNETKSRPS